MAPLCLLSATLALLLFRAAEGARPIGLCSGPPVLTDGRLVSSDTQSLERRGAVELRPFAPNASLPEGDVHCRLRLTACASCLLQLEWPSGLADKGVRLCSAAFGRESWAWSACVDVEVEEAAESDRRYPVPPPFAAFSVLERLGGSAAQSRFNSTGSALLFSLRMSGAGEASRALLQSLFPLTLNILDNTIVVRGRPDSGDILSLEASTGFLASPRFPAHYPSGAVQNLTLVNAEAGGRVRLEFTDFRVHPESALRMVDSDGVEVRYNGGSGGERRPLAWESSGQTASLLFAANHYTRAPGFRLRYTFVRGGAAWHSKPSRDADSCDERLDDFGGEISARRSQLAPNSYVDCVWIVHKRDFVSPMHNKLFVKVENFSMASNSEGIHLEIRRGLTSLDHLLFDEWSPRSQAELAAKQPQEGFVIDLTNNDRDPVGFYIRLHGYLGSYSGLRISFAQFYTWANAQCRSKEDEFHCENSRCIRASLLCDGADHCGDYSDERDARCGAGGGTLPGAIRPRRRMEDGHSISGYTTTVVLVAGLIGLTLLMLVVTLIVARVYRQRLIHRLTRATLEVPRDDASRNGPSVQRIGDRRFFVMPESDASLNVQMFEAPPTYDDALKHPSVPPELGSELSAAQLAYANEGFREEAAGPSASWSPDEEDRSPPRCRRHHAARPTPPSSTSSSSSSEGGVAPSPRRPLSGILDWARHKVSPVDSAAPPSVAEAKSDSEEEVAPPPPPPPPPPPYSASAAEAGPPSESDCVESAV